VSPAWRRVPWTLRYRSGRRLASDLRRLSVLATHRHCRVEFNGPVHLGPGFSLEIWQQGSFVVGPDCQFRRGFVCEIAGDGRVEIGPRAVFTSNALIQCTTTVTVGADAQFGQSVFIADGNHRFRDHTIPFLEQGFDFRPIDIGAGAVILSKCTIIANVGERAVVGAHALVNRDIPAYCLAVGVPARVVEYFGPPDRRPAGLEC